MILGMSFVLFFMFDKNENESFSKVGVHFDGVGNTQNQIWQQYAMFDRKILLLRTLIMKE